MNERIIYGQVGVVLFVVAIGVGMFLHPAGYLIGLIAAVFIVAGST